MILTINELLIKLLWHSSINLRSTVVEYLLFNTKLKETLTKEEAQKILVSIGNKYKVISIVQKDLPIIYSMTSFTLDNERHQNLTTTIRLLHNKIPVHIDQQRILDQFPITEDNLEKIIQTALFIKLGRSHIT